MSKKIFYIGSNQTFWTNLVTALIALNHTNNTQHEKYEDENLGAIACSSESPDIMIFDCDTPQVLKHAEDTFSYPGNKGKVFFRGLLAPAADDVYKQYCLPISSHEREEIGINQTMQKALATLGLLS